MSSDDRGTNPATPTRSVPPDPESAAFAAELKLARRHCEAGNFAAAEGMCRQMLRTAPGQPQVVLMLGQVLWSQARHQEAIAILEPLVQQYPNAGLAHYSLGNALHSVGRYTEAARYLQRATELLPRFASAHCNLGLALAQLGGHAGAIQAYERAVMLQPDLAAARTNLGVALVNANRAEASVPHLRRAVALNPTAAGNHLFLGLALQQMGNITEALPHYERAVAIDANCASGWIGIGAVMRALGRFEDAAAAYQKALVIMPDLGPIHHALSSVRQQIADAGELDRLQTILADPAKGLDDRAAAGMTMAKIFDDSGRYDVAFAAALEGNRLARAGQLAANIRYDHDAFRAQNDALMRVFTPEFFAQASGWGNRSELPVFIVGYFRTGTTLVEQICASHSQVHGVGESRDIPQIAARIQITPPQQWTADLFRPLADRHVERLAALAPGKLRVVDKMLDNIYRLGMIAALFPCARIIFTHRDGRDAALSVFMQHFGKELACATDLVDAGRRWHETERMSAYWESCLPLSVHHVQYETLIADFETEARKLVNFLGLDWEPACLEFHKTERPVSTASTWQVRQPLYASSVGRWRNYAKHLAPLCAAMRLDPEAPMGARPADIG